ncbi:hypothetical protein PYCCODRAFT_1473446 [Trametes coccinea BRFM310]|uniref:Uncharacterized protein n=1 Tax=Trametes coccinea (strain BRFM310) TaxID=1353009 RepID=A0A1Y2J5S6_TRAC3|nr:hypothetical protein PYCCODRAFT_1473446 [Trametes coccinea BRFM310]
MRGLPASLKNIVTKRATPQARQFVLSLIQEQKQPLTVQEIYNLALERQQTHEGEPVLPSMRYLKKVVLPELAGADKVERVHAKVKLSKEELAELRAKMGESSRKAATLSPNAELWRWQLKQKEAAPPAPEEKAVFGREVGVGADWSHLNRRRQQAREEKVKRDVQWLKELERARQDGSAA